MRRSRAASSWSQRRCRRRDCGSCESLSTRGRCGGAAAAAECVTGARWRWCVRTEAASGAGFPPVVRWKLLSRTSATSPEAAETGLTPYLGKCGRVNSAVSAASRHNVPCPSRRRGACQQVRRQRHAGEVRPSLFGGALGGGKSEQQGADCHRAVGCGGGGGALRARTAAWRAQRHHLRHAARESETRVAARGLLDGASLRVEEVPPHLVEARRREADEAAPRLAAVDELAQCLAGWSWIAVRACWRRRRRGGRRLLPPRALVPYQSAASLVDEPGNLPSRQRAEQYDQRAAVLNLDGGRVPARGSVVVGLGGARSRPDHAGGARCND
mmetsp:Transcript_49107/g.163967  ORF Transcript_49107/g.163967 Transcript_49107/m.163967 type:complete len:328 (-) Transcript_49107:538-1521(-)